MSTLSDLPNIGNVLAKLLVDAGVDTPEALRKMGSKEAFIRLKMRDDTCCLHKLYALQGAVEGIRYTYLSKEMNQELKDFFNAL
ncbi:TfoX/Sxy family protein [Clostridium oryzae]|uniref:TfoX C-terminal domain-containing protein n=1 Tax=Clostridium oryzae TaxID=1450648 RepID=A0A1V4IRU9_9CLOT|nr:TfoX/Sxy family protein [Clostridium oryzae]OPJ62761.1 hypothetical protein CLORY_16410 [Clostridium oryzae]